MNFKGWIESPILMMAVYETERSYLCVKYVGGNKVVGAEKECFTKEELADFLLSIPSCPVVDVHKLLNQL